jgi:hypothetical protein
MLITSHPFSLMSGFDYNTLTAFRRCHRKFTIHREFIEKGIAMERNEKADLLRKMLFQGTWKALPSPLAQKKVWNP